MCRNKKKDGSIWYPIIGFKGKTYNGHRLVWILTNGKINGSKMQVLHKCDNPGCLNIDHLYIGTHADNMRDIRDRKRSWWIQRKTCKNGHEWSIENTRYGKRQRICIKCKSEVGARYRLKNPPPKSTRRLNFCRNGHKKLSKDWFVLIGGKRMCKECRFNFNNRRRYVRSKNRTK